MVKNLNEKQLKKRGEDYDKNKERYKVKKENMTFEQKIEHTNNASWRTHKKRNNYGVLSPEDLESKKSEYFAHLTDFREQIKAKRIIKALD